MSQPLKPWRTRDLLDKPPKAQSMTESQLDPGFKKRVLWWIAIIVLSSLAGAYFKSERLKHEAAQKYEESTSTGGGER